MSVAQIAIGTLAALVLAYPGRAAAQSPTPEPTEASSIAPPGEAKTLQLAAGMSLGWQERQDYGSSSRSNLVPELVCFGYLPTNWSRVFLRPGARLAYSGIDQPDYPNGISYREHDAMVSGEVGVVYDALVLPSASAGAGLNYRRIGTNSSIASVDSSPLEGSELQPMLYMQMGAGLSIARGRVVLEPFVRYEWMRRDPRLGWRYGLEVSVQIF